MCESCRLHLRHRYDFRREQKRETDDDNDDDDDDDGASREGRRFLRNPAKNRHGNFWVLVNSI